MSPCDIVLVENACGWVRIAFRARNIACFSCYLIIEKQTGLAVLEQMEPADPLSALGEVRSCQPL